MYYCAYNSACVYYSQIKTSTCETEQIYCMCAYIALRGTQSGNTEENIQLYTTVNTHSFTDTNTYHSECSQNHRCKMAAGKHPLKLTLQSIPETSKSVHSPPKAIYLIMCVCVCVCVCKESRHTPIKHNIMTTCLMLCCSPFTAKTARTHPAP